MKKAWMSWSSGKDSAFALYELSRQPDIRTVGLLTTVNETHERVAMHAVRDELLARQADELGLPLHRVKIPHGCSDELYASRMREAVAAAVKAGVTHMAFGDLFLEDIKTYRETMLASTPIQPLFPLWKRPTQDLAIEMIAAGQKAIITCVDPKKLPAHFAGREFDRSFLADLPPGVDPCGENGEFHSFVYDSPGFKRAIPVRVGEVVGREGFVFADLKISSTAGA
ncbi:MAG: adenine nucleotide alpha hydrolase [Oligoflexia bacterium]|nr:adenine nucleotide alpha hydrolase [Oligoflexia bacterium]